MRYSYTIEDSFWQFDLNFEKFLSYKFLYCG